MAVKIEKLLLMAEQITDNMRFTEDAQQVAEKIADHLNRFWDPRMRGTLKDYYEQTKDGKNEADHQFSNELALAVPLLNR